MATVKERKENGREQIISLPLFIWIVVVGTLVGVGIYSYESYLYRESLEEKETQRGLIQWALGGEKKVLQTEIDNEMNTLVAKIMASGTPAGLSEKMPTEEDIRAFLALLWYDDLEIIDPLDTLKAIAERPERGIEVLEENLDQPPYKIRIRTKGAFLVEREYRSMVKREMKKRYSSLSPVAGKTLASKSGKCECYQLKLGEDGRWEKNCLSDVLEFTAIERETGSNEKGTDNKADDGSVNPLLLEVDLGEGWKRVNTIREYREYEIFEKDGPNGVKFVRLKTRMEGDEEAQKSLIRIAFWEISYHFGDVPDAEAGNLIRLDGIREFLGLIYPRQN